jgi:hypothetical protein
MSSSRRKIFTRNINYIFGYILIKLALSSPLFPTVFFRIPRVSFQALLSWTPLSGNEVIEVICGYEAGKQWLQSKHMVPTQQCLETYSENAEKSRLIRAELSKIWPYKYLMIREKLFTLKTMADFIETSVQFNPVNWLKSAENSTL